ncbi:beta/gamma crystallin-related protein [Phenylobacterium aquaticum]|uniref:beta/gamma crystallin-related protein n=1 Tax=Phenylobacterium aquaticum TaxID=1763816 RepID=UPI0026F24A90|nr:beta/gamma crystallin-related protein [Phenylobacterium aquaticum]
MAYGLRAVLASLALVAVASAAEAQPQPTGHAAPPSSPRVTLYELPNFQGRQITLAAAVDDLSSLNFNDAAQSARFEGRWRVCEDSDYRGKCKDVGGDVPDLARVGMGAKISSMQAYLEGAWDRGSAWSPGGSWNGVQGGRPYEGATGVLFAYPSVAGFDIAASGSSANAFCRSVELGSASYYDSSQRAAQALDVGGRFVGETAILRDVFCRKR